MSRFSGALLLAGALSFAAVGVAALAVEGMRVEGTAMAA